MPARTHSSTSVAQKVAVTSAAGVDESKGIRALADHTEAPNDDFNDDFSWQNVATVNHKPTPLSIRIEGPPVTEGTSFADRSPVVAIHGFTQNIDCWGPFGDLLASAGQTTFVDAPGHGQSQHDSVDLWEAARLTVTSAGHGVYVGYSMGGRIALHAALAHPEALAGLVLIGATAGIRSPKERHERRDADSLLAESLRTEGLEKFLARWLAGPLFAGLTNEQACQHQRLRNRADGLAASLLACGTGSQDDLWDRLAEINVPVLLLSGSEDSKFTDLAQTMLGRFGGPVEHQVIQDAGHCVHLEAPGDAFAAIEQWMATQC